MEHVQKEPTDWRSEVFWHHHRYQNSGAQGWWESKQVTPGRRRSIRNMYVQDTYTDTFQKNMYTICIHYSHVRMRTHTLIFTYVHGCVFMTYTYMFIMIWTWPEGAWMSRTHSFTTNFRNYMSPKIRMNKSQKIPKNMRVPNLDHFANQKPLEFHIYISSYQRLPRVRIFQPHGDDLLSFCPITLGNYVVIFSGWWFGTFFF